MSATLTATVESLHIIAAQKLMELLQTEKDPSLLARLIATAFRFKLPRLGKDTAPKQPPTHPHPPAHARSTASRHADTQDPPQSDPAAAAPLQPYTEQEIRDLVNRYGPADARAIQKRRNALIANATTTG